MYAHIAQQNWLSEGQTVLDCFGGVALGGYDAIRAGYQWVGVEVEPRFIDMGRGCDCTGISKADWVRFYGRWSRVSHTLGHHWCPRCLAEAPQITGMPPSRKRTFRTKPRNGRAVRTKTDVFVPLPFPDRRDGVRPPGRREQFGMLTIPTASYARGSGCIPTTAPHHYEGNTERWTRQGYGEARLLQGDSRRLQTVLDTGAGDCVIGSPPFCDSDGRKGGSDLYAKHQLARGRHPGKPHMQSHTTQQPYGDSPHNLGNLPPGDITLAVSSPPYSSTDTKPTHLGTGKGTRATGDSASRNKGDYHYPHSPGQLGAMPACDLAVASPPYADRCANDNQRTLARDGLQQGHNEGDGHTYGATTGQLSSMPLADLALSSPPYANGCTHTGGADPQPQHIQGGAVRQVAYGHTEGQLADLSISSPPYEATVNSGSHGIDWSKAGPATGNRTRGEGCKHEATLRAQLAYGQEEGQLGSIEGQTFWEAAALVIQGVWEVLRPGGVCIWVVKNYIRDGREVDFTGDWARLNTHIGFEWLHWHKALLVESHGTQRDLFQEDKVQETRRESFFRRLARKKTGLAIDYESVLCFRKPLTAAPMPPDTAWQQPGFPFCDTASSPPPYAGREGTLGHNNNIDYGKSTSGGSRRTPARDAYGRTYGQTAGQLGAMPEGTPAGKR